MIDMKRTKEDMKKEKGGICCETDYEPDKYPYGLRVSLNKDSLKKLNMKAEDFKVGVKVKLVAEVEVVGVRTSAGSKGNNDDVDLQITKMELSGDKKSKAQKFMDTMNDGPGGVAE